MTKNLLLILIIIFVSNISFSQEIQYEWDKCGAADPEKEMELRNMLGTSWGYNYDSLLNDLGYWDANQYVQSASIGQSLQSREIYELTITDFSVVKSSKHRIFIHARTHPNEVQAFWVTDEMINYLIGNDPIGVFLRQNCIFHIIPMYNPDGVELEYNRENSNGIDLESNWGASVPEVEVLNIKSRMMNLMLETNPVEIALNMHSAYECNRFFIYHHENGTSPSFALQEQNFIGDVRSHYIEGIQPYDHYISWSGGTPTQYPESWWWNSYQDQVMALTYEDMNCVSAGNYQKTAYAILHGISDYLGLGFQGVNRNEANNLNIKIFPNPSNGQFNIEGSDIHMVEIIDNQGRMIYSQKAELNNSKFEIDISYNPKGLYFVRINTLNGVVVSKVIIE